MKLLQQYAHMLMNGVPPKNNKSPVEQREMAAVARSQRLRQFWRFIPESSFKMRKEYFVAAVRIPLRAVKILGNRYSPHYMHDIGMHMLCKSSPTWFF
jgi:hypothetical protein